MSLKALSLAVLSINSAGNKMETISFLEEGTEGNKHPSASIADCMMTLDKLGLWEGIYREAESTCPSLLAKARDIGRHLDNNPQSKDYLKKWHMIWSNIWIECNKIDMKTIINNQQH